MTYKVMVTAVLDELETERAAYISSVVEVLESDPRAEEIQNILYLTLSNSMKNVPICLDKIIFVDILFEFLIKNNGIIIYIIYRKEYIYNSVVVRQVTDRFIELVIDSVLECYEAGELDTHEPKKLTYRWLYDDLEFPYDWDDDNDEDAWLVDTAENHRAVLNG